MANTQVLAGKVALITGGAGDIGWAVAAQLAKEGAAVALLDVPEQAGRAVEVCAQIQGQGGQAAFFSLDVRKSDEVERALDGAQQTLGAVDLLINCAGVIRWSPLREMSEDDWDLVLDINLRGTFLMCRAVSRAMVARGASGRIVNLASGLATRPSAEVAAYAASKAGVIAMSKALALELAPHNILVNCVAPGMVDTRLVADKRSRQEIENYAKNTPLGRVAEPEDVADTVLYLCSPASRFLTGQTIWLNGGGLML